MHGIGFREGWKRGVQFRIVSRGRSKTRAPRNKPDLALEWYLSLDFDTNFR